MNRYVLYLAITSMMAFTALISWNIRQSLQVYDGVREAQATLNKNVRELRVQLADLEEERARLADDMGYYEQLGREELGMIRPEELVFIIPLRD